jgi:hypothetical protein
MCKHLSTSLKAGSAVGPAARFSPARVVDSRPQKRALGHPKPVSGQDFGMLRAGFGHARLTSIGLDRIR